MGGRKGVGLCSSGPQAEGSVGAKHGAIKISEEILVGEARGKAKPEPRDPKKSNRGTKKRDQSELIYHAHFGLLRAWTLKEY